MERRCYMNCRSIAAMRQLLEGEGESIRRRISICRCQQREVEWQPGNYRKRTIQRRCVWKRKRFTYEKLIYNEHVHRDISVVEEAALPICYQRNPVFLHLDKWRRRISNRQQQFFSSIVREMTWTLRRDSSKKIVDLIHSSKRLACFQLTRDIFLLSVFSYNQQHVFFVFLSRLHRSSYTCRRGVYWSLIEFTQEEKQTASSQRRLTDRVEFAEPDIEHKDCERQKRTPTLHSLPPDTVVQAKLSLNKWRFFSDSLA